VDQEYLRSQPVNSEEGRADGHRHWYEMFHLRSDGLYLPQRRSARLAALQRQQRGVRCLSNMKLAAMLENRHDMSRTVAPKSRRIDRVGFYNVGPVYIRRVHFRDEA